MRILGILIQRNIKLFFKDKGTFLTSLIAPLIILVLFITFLGGIYKNVFIPTDENMLPQLPSQLINGFCGGWLLSCLLAVCTVTVAFSANMCMVKDKTSGVVNDFYITTVKKSILALGYYIATTIVTLIICLVTLGIGFIYIACVGWFISVKDVFLILLDVVILVLFGTALSSIICSLINSQGGITAVTTIVSSMYGFLCGAYMPISEFSTGIQNVIMLLPGSYGTSLLHRHFLSGALEEIETTYHYPYIDEFKKSFDIDLTFFSHKVSPETNYIVVISSVIVLIGIYIVIHLLKKRSKNR